MTFGTAQVRYRPAGVTVLVILHIIIGLFTCFTGVLLFVAYTRPSLIPGFTSFATSVVGVSSGFGFLILGIGSFWFVYSVFSFLLAYALWKGMGWSWTTSLVLATNGLLIGGLGLLLGSFANIITLIVYGVILIYLFMRNVRIFFGRTPIFSLSSQPLPVAPEGPTYWSQPRYHQSIRGHRSYYARIQQSGQLRRGDPWVRSCPACGAMAPYNFAFCTICGMRLT